MDSKPPNDEKGVTAYRGDRPAGHDQGKTEETAIAAKPNLPPSPARNEATRNKDKEGRDRVKFWAEMFGLIVLIAYTISSFLLWRQAEIANNMTLRNFRDQHRAWVFMDAIETETDANGKPKIVSPIELKVGDLFFVRVNFKNTGNSPALSFSTSTIVEVGWSRTPVQQTFPFEEVAPGHRTLPTGKDTYEDPIIWQHINKIQLESLNHNQLMIWVHGRIVYHDVFGVEHWTRFCSVLLSGGGWAICEQGNEADENPELPPVPPWWKLW